MRNRQARVRLRIISNEEEPNEEDDAVAADLHTSAEAEPAAVKDDVASVTLGDEQKMIMQIAKTVLEGLLEKMKVNAKVEASYIENNEDKDEPVLLLDIVGDDLSILIGRRSETLNALQYITNLIVGKELGHWVPLIVDVQGYRIRRERQLRQLARRMADQAVQSGRRQLLEPMPANERRLIHLELRDHADVVTRSVGEEPYRKVTISLK